MFLGGNEWGKRKEYLLWCAGEDTILMRRRRRRRPVVVCMRVCDVREKGVSTVSTQ